ncbi:uncharacterized protein B0H18DRAFT_521730 [Fomitopsis serialis]|uniref:uncharacterized protein n=1 Tax=Fomitopsis serialis TaxID=139415 RepID=UPI00200868A4|nr:uncharacterized protein B0H18DRAFT_521730 [Neoantrodia serialis]KAH9922179.1 hypothetical protein B0H18DRAFT_521730 [Neoantrodia serialis]
MTRFHCTPIHSLTTVSLFLPTGLGNMAIESPNPIDAPRVNGHAEPRPGVPDLDPSKLNITMTQSPKPIPHRKL